ncbi:MAG TPA: hypothetical protein VF849_01090 [Blattabacteriaceae bacterium]
MKTVEKKLRALYRLQLVDSQIDKLRGLVQVLPLEIQVLEDKLKEFWKKMKSLKKVIASLEERIEEKKLENSKNQSKKWDNKELEFHQLEIELSSKKIKEYQLIINEKKEEFQNLKENYENKKKNLLFKKNIFKKNPKNKKKVDVLRKRAYVFNSKIDKSLLYIYNKIRKKVKDGRAVVPVEKGASMGSYLLIPPQLRVEISNREKIVLDETSGRILIDSALAKEERERIYEEITPDPRSSSPLYQEANCPSEMEV